jgi:AsmA protein
MKLTNVSIGVHAKDGITRIAPAKAQLYGGQYTGAVTLDERASTSVLNIDQTMTSIDVAQLLDDFAKTKRLSGRGNVTTHLIARGRTSEEMIKTLSGHIDANLANGALEGIDLWYEINRAQSLLKQQALPAGSSAGRTAFDTFRASADLNNGIATTKDLTITSQLLRVTGQGYTNLVSQVIDYDINATVLKAPPAAAQNAISSGTIAGCVRDSSGGVVSGASVTVISNETELSRDGDRQIDIGLAKGVGSS